MEMLNYYARSEVKSCLHSENDGLARRFLYSSRVGGGCLGIAARDSTNSR